MFGLAAAAVAVAVLLTASALASSNSHAAATTACTQRGTISFGIAGGGINTLDPTTVSLASHTVILPLLFGGLTEITQNGSVKAVLATRWKVSPDLKTWWFWIRHNIRYANGRPFTSADVVSNILRDLDPKVGSNARGYIKDIRSVRAINKYEVRFKLGSPSTIFPAELAEASFGDTTDVSKLSTSGNGVGPYKVASYVPNQRLALVPNPYYYGSKPCLKEIDILAQPDTTSMVTAFTSQKLSMIWQVPVTDVDKVRQDKDAKILNAGLASNAHVLMVDMTSPPFDNVLARRALVYATDRQAMTKVALLGEATPSLANDLINSDSPFYDKKLPVQPFNLSKAQQLFTQAGVKPGTSFTFWAQAGKRPEWITLGEILQQDLKKIGINLKIVQNDPSTWISGFDPPGKKYPGLIVVSSLSIRPTPSLSLGHALTGACDCNWDKTTGQGYDTFASLVKQSMGIADKSKRQSILSQAQQLFANRNPLVVVAHQSNIVASQKSIIGAWENPVGGVHLEDARLAR
jgi:peptide/nickel transport system substrate-binding protein